LVRRRYIRAEFWEGRIILARRNWTYRELGKGRTEATAWADAARRLK
jgi:hypothetical protein